MHNLVKKASTDHVSSSCVMTQMAVYLASPGSAVTACSLTESVSSNDEDSLYPFWVDMFLY